MNRLKEKITVLPRALLLALLFAGSSTLWADDKNFGLMLGGYITNSKAEVVANRAGLIEVEVDFVEDLGLDDSTTIPYLRFEWAFSQKWFASLSFNSYSENALKTLEEEINFDGVVYPVNAELDSELGIDVYVLNFGYDIYQSDTASVSLGFGLHSFEFETTLQGTLDLNGNVNELEQSSETLLVPLPNFKFYSKKQLSDKWFWNVELGWLSANVDDYDGSLTFINTDFQYRFTESFAIGLGYQLTTIEVSRENTLELDEYEVDFEGTLVYGKFRF